MLQLNSFYFKKNEAGPAEGNSQPGKIRVATGSCVYYIEQKDIVRIQSLSSYSKLFFSSGKTLTVSKVLGYFDELLTDGPFFRVHRTHLVNLHYLKHLEGSMTQIGLYNDEVLPVSRRRKKVLRQKMTSFCL